VIKTFKTLNKNPLKSKTILAGAGLIIIGLYALIMGLNGQPIDQEAITAILSLLTGLGVIGIRDAL